MRAPLRPRELCVIGLVWLFGLAASGTHLVSSGETLASIARDHGTTVAAIVEANGIRNPNLIYAGQRLTVPDPARPGASPSTTAPAARPTAPTSTTVPATRPVGTTHVVRMGETLGGIAARYGTTVSAIVQANSLANANRITAGTSLLIPTAAPTTSVPPAGGPTATSVPAAPSDAESTESTVELPGQRHTVRMGDTISAIAARYGIAIANFVKWNGLIDGKIYATTRLLLYNPGELDPSAEGYRCPVEGGTYFNDWAFPRSNGRSHAGTDIFAPRGTAVRAPASGFVEVATGSIGGHQFRLTTADGTRWYGTHMDRFGATGQVVAGTVIGYVGDSGNARGGKTHLHFEIHPGGGEAVNPYPMLRQSC